ncbi:MAG: hypothetical protein ACRDUV_20395 [Pseudonocardiaceae bacterium]
MQDGQQSAADSHDVIEVRGARENNLADISLDIPKRRLTVFTGVSGSGKSSLVFGTIAAESQRLINETYTAFIQSFMPSLGRTSTSPSSSMSNSHSMRERSPFPTSPLTPGTGRAWPTPAWSTPTSR